MAVVNQVNALIAILWITTTTSSPVPVPSEQFLLHEVLDHLGNYHLFWKFNSSHITFEVHVKTKGYVGFGISPNGKMYPSDVVVGWVKDGVSYISDRHAVEHSQPLADDSQDWELLHAEENDFGTMLKFTRPLITCDRNDTDIVDDTMRIIYSYHPDDPVNEDSLQWHGANRRGAKSMLLLSTSKQYPLPDDTQTKDLIHHQFHIPIKRTTYQCRVHSFQEVKTKHHVIKFEAAIQKGNEPYVHHMNIHKCRHYPKRYIGTNFECYEVAVDMMPCGNIVAGWAVGSGPFHFPQNVGLPVGENEHEYAYIIEIHYNNPGAVSGLVDSSGIRFHYTSHLRKHDAGILPLGLYENKQQIIPPGYSNFLVNARTDQNCIARAFTEKSLDEIKLFATWQHAHLLGREIRTRHFRGDIELKPIAEDRHYDFDYQETRIFKNEVSFQKGDSIQVECTYDSTGQQNYTFGGFSTADEMCFSFIYYYPRLSLAWHSQSTLYDTISGHRPINGDFKDFQAVDELIQSLDQLDWSDKLIRDQFQQDVLNSTVSHFCMWTSSPSPSISKTTKLEEPRVPYKAPPSVCQQE